MDQFFKMSLQFISSKNIKSRSKRKTDHTIRSSGQARRFQNITAYKIDFLSRLTS